MFLTLWLENGVLGLLAYLIVLIGCFWHFKEMRDARGQAFCLALFVFSFFSHNLGSYRPVYVTLGLLSAMAFSQARGRVQSIRRNATFCHAAALSLTPTTVEKRERSGRNGYLNLPPE